MELISHLTEFSAPQILDSGWTVSIDTHFLGGLRHFYNKWEIADIGLLVHYRKHGKLVRSKTAVLQSKRLYPQSGAVKEDMRIDYEIGFGRLADPEPIPPLYSKSVFRFNENSRYEALKAHDDQFNAIKQYMAQSKVPVFYQFYNPADLPWEQTYPLTKESRRIRSYDFATRVMRASDVIACLAGKPKNYVPSVLDLAPDRNDMGWRLEAFIVDLIRCKEGLIFKDIAEADINSLFNRRSGPIAAAVAFSVEMPAD